MRVFSLVTAAIVASGHFCVAGSVVQRDAPCVSSAGQTSTIPGWYMQSSEHASTDMIALSRSGADVSKWYRVGSHQTVMAGLIQNNVYNDKTLFFSDNLATMVNQSEFTVPWLYREELIFSPQADQLYFIETNGITSMADLYVNGVQIASKKTLKGAYGGLKFDITKQIIKGKNTVLIRAYPTSYLADFALGFVDWNPYPADNGTGVWREVTISQTDVVSILKPRVITDYTGGAANKVTATVKVDVQNSGSKTIQGTLKGVIKEGSTSIPVSTSYTLKAGEVKTISLSAVISQPKIWWPKLWGAQPLYTLDLAAYIGSDKLSDSAAQRTFGIRHVTKTLNKYNDTSFFVNGNYFQVLGGGYSADMFLRFDEAKLASQFTYMLDMGMNTVRLEGKQEQPGLYDLADRMGIMILAGWECCDKWEGWTYNDEVDGLQVWVDDDYDTADKQMHHEAYMMQGHAAMLGFLVGSDFWPDDRAVKIYVDQLTSLDWDVPIIASAAKRGFPELLGPGGMKMEGPYDWNSPTYWYNDTELGAAFGFASELGSGVGTPELSSLKKFLSTSDLQDLWTAPDKGLYHMSTLLSSFHTRSIYNDALYKRYGPPKSLSDYLLKAQIMDYEATRVQYEAYAARRNAVRPATGLIYWMVNNAWPSLHWNQFDYYLKAAGSYFGSKTGSRPEHVAFEYGSKSGDIWLINHTIDKSGARTVDIDLLSTDGKTLVSKVAKATTKPNYSQKVAEIPEATKLKDVAFLRLVLKDAAGAVLSRNVYWLAATVDVNDWDNSTWYNTPVSSYADYTALQSLKPASLAVTASGGKTVQLENKSKVPAFFVRLELQDGKGDDVLPAIWTDNYVTLWPGEKLSLTVTWGEGSAPGKVVKISGGNVGDQSLKLQ